MTLTAGCALGTVVAWAFGASRRDADLSDGHAQLEVLKSRYNMQPHREGGSIPKLSASLRM